MKKRHIVKYRSRLLYRLLTNLDSAHIPDRPLGHVLTLPPFLVRDEHGNHAGKFKG